MHNALVIQEILSNIFDYAQAQKGDLASLASTCRAFKEPALDVLWRDIWDLSVLALCLPEASRECEDNPKCYSFHRPLARTEWKTLRSYTRRIKYIILDDVNGLDQKSLKSLSKSPSGELLFPNVRHLRLDKYISEKATSLFLFPLPSLTQLEVEVYEYDSFLLANSFNSLVKTSPKLADLHIGLWNLDDVDISSINLGFVCQLQYLKEVECLEAHLDVTSLVHLTSMPALTRLSFTVCSTLPDEIPCHAPLVFPRLAGITLSSESLGTVSQLLSRIRTPNGSQLFVLLKYSPSKQDLSSFFSSIKISGMDRNIEDMYLVQCYRPTFAPRRGMLEISLEDLEPCIAFRTLFRFTFDIECIVKLTDNDMLTLTSNWCHLQHLLINEEWGWNTEGGITPDGLRTLILKNAFLDTIALAIDTQGFTTIPPWSSKYGFDFPGKINVVDSFIEAESVPAIAAFLARMRPISRSLSFSGWCSPRMERNPNQAVCENRWQEVFAMVDSWGEEKLVDEEEEEDASLMASSTHTVTP